MESALYTGFIEHERFLPKSHRFKYPFFMWYLDLDEIDSQPELGRWFSKKRWAMSRFNRADYLGSPDRPLGDCVKEEMSRLTGTQVTGRVFGLLNLRTMGLYFSPVNFYFGFSKDGGPSHLLAEVSIRRPSPGTETDRSRSRSCHATAGIRPTAKTSVD